MAKGEISKCAAEWATVNHQGRLTIPAEITDCLSWFAPAKGRVQVSLDLSRPNLVVIRNLEEVKGAIELQQDTILEESETPEIGMRRVAMTSHFFRRGTLIVSSRRVGLKVAILDHLRTKPGGRLFCVGFADRVEAYNEEAAHEIMAIHADDIAFS
jgi:hypothetical protein